MPTRIMDGILALWLQDLADYQRWVSSPFAWVAFGFQLWMLIDAIRREEWMWVLFIIVFPVINAVLYFFLVYRAAVPSGAQAFQLPGAGDRRRIKELQAQIHHLDKAHHHAELGDIYFHQGKFDKAEPCYRRAFERDSQDIDIRAHLGQTLLRLGQPMEARPLLEGVCSANPKHDYGYSLMALAESYSTLGEKEKALEAWQSVAANYSYARARVELAQLHLEGGQPDLAKARLQEVVADDAHAPDFERRHERTWTKRARRMLARMA